MDNCTGKKIEFAHSLHREDLFRNEIYTEFVQIRQLPLFYNGCKALHTWYLQQVCTRQTLGKFDFSYRIYCRAFCNMIDFLLTACWFISWEKRKQDRGWWIRYFRKRKQQIIPGYTFYKNKDTRKSRNKFVSVDGQCWPSCPINKKEFNCKLNNKFHKYPTQDKKWHANKQLFTGKLWVIQLIQLKFSFQKRKLWTIREPTTNISGQFQQIKV